MNKKKFIKNLDKTRIPYIYLSSIKKNDNKDLDIYIEPKYKKKFEKFTLKYNFFKRKLNVFNLKNRYFYINEAEKNKVLVDVSYEIIFKKNFFSYYFIKSEKIKKLIKNKKAFCFLYTIAKYFWVKKISLKKINNFIFDKSYNIERKYFNINKKFYNQFFHF